LVCEHGVLARGVASFKVHEHLRSKLCDQYENDSILDKFECTLSGDGSRVTTGFYR
jgi:serine/threonine-protein phosphatase 2A regulatory subunit B